MTTFWWIVVGAGFVVVLLDLRFNFIKGTP